MKTEILRMLKSTEDYLSGQQLCGMLGVSRTAVWKAVGELREEGYGYGRIAQTLGLSENTIKTYCRRHGLGGVAVSPAPADEEIHHCLCCGTVVVQNNGRKEKKFCSDKCRNRWWNANLDKVNRKAEYNFVCAYCKKPFSAYGNKHRKYCSHECYILDRFGGEQ